jgi:hypothetical protein
MLQKVTSTFKHDDNGNPAGGSTTGTGIDIQWQDGPLGPPENRLPANGAFIEGVIQAAIERLEFFQHSKFSCRENAIALTHLETALLWLQKRTMDREMRGVEGQHKI